MRSSYFHNLLISKLNPLKKMIIKFLTGLLIGIIFSVGYVNADPIPQIPKSVVSAIVKETLAGKVSNPTAANIKVRAKQVNLFLESVGGGGAW